MMASTLLVLASTLVADLFYGRSQRMELAAYANDLIQFEPGTRVLFQGQITACCRFLFSYTSGHKEFTTTNWKRAFMFSFFF